MWSARDLRLSCWFITRQDYHILVTTLVKPSIPIKIPLCLVRTNLSHGSNTSTCRLEVEHHTAAGLGSLQDRRDRQDRQDHPEAAVADHIDLEEGLHIVLEEVVRRTAAEAALHTDLGAELRTDPGEVAHRIAAEEVHRIGLEGELRIVLEELRIQQGAGLSSRPYYRSCDQWHLGAA